MVSLRFAGEAGGDDPCCRDNVAIASGVTLSDVIAIRAVLAHEHETLLGEGPPLSSAEIAGVEVALGRLGQWSRRGGRAP